MLVKNLILFLESLSDYRWPQIIKFTKVVVPNLFSGWIPQQKFYMLPMKTLKEN